MTLAGKIYNLLKENGEMTAGGILKALGESAKEQCSPIEDAMRMTYMEREIPKYVNATAKEALSCSSMPYFRNAIQKVEHDFELKLFDFFEKNYWKKGLSPYRYFMAKIHDAGTIKWMTELCKVMENNDELGQSKAIRELVAVSRKAGYTGYRYENGKCVYFATR